MVDFKLVMNSYGAECRRSVITVKKPAKRILLSTLVASLPNGVVVPIVVALVMVVEVVALPRPQ